MVRLGFMSMYDYEGPKGRQLVNKHAGIGNA